MANEFVVFQLIAILLYNLEKHESLHIIVFMIYNIWTKVFQQPSGYFRNNGLQQRYVNKSTFRKVFPAPE